uniref:Uncharacterized protein n=1 Tax=Glossina pallidipes TaxID=7398 RepID=A0A1A9ZPT4_GLOPL
MKRGFIPAENEKHRSYEARQKRQRQLLIVFNVIDITIIRGTCNVTKISGLVANIVFVNIVGRGCGSGGRNHFVRHTARSLLIWKAVMMIAFAVLVAGKSAGGGDDDDGGGGGWLAVVWATIDGRPESRSYSLTLAALEFFAAFERRHRHNTIEKPVNSRKAIDAITIAMTTDVVKLDVSIRYDLPTESKIQNIYTVASEPDACIAIVSTTSHAAIDDSRFTKDSTIAISERQVAATLIPTTCELGSYVTCNGGGILLTLVVAITSFE